MGGVSQNAVVKSQIDGSIDDLTNSTIADDGTTVTIGISTTAALSIPGDVRLREYDQSGLAFLQARNPNSNTDIGLRLRTQQAGPSGPGVIEAVTIDKYGNVDVGSDSPTSNFQVDQSTTGPGTVSITNGSDVVTGSGTQFLNTFKVWDTITVTGQTPRTIVSITDDTHLKVSSTYGSTTSGLLYTLVGGTRLAVKGNGYCGHGTADPKGLLQLACSYIVAPAPSGDTSGATDWDNIMAAIKAVYNYIDGAADGPHKAGTVCLQAGRYIINKTLHCKGTDADGVNNVYANGLKLIGAGMETTIIKMNYGNATDVIKIENCLGVTAQDLSIEAVQDKIHTGIRITGTAVNGRHNVENVRMHGMNTGVLCINNSYNNTFKHINLFAGHIGAQIGVSGYCSNGNRFYGGSIIGCDVYGVDFFNGYGNLLSGVTIEGNGTANNNNYGGVRFGDSNNYGNSIIGCYLEGNKPWLVRLDTPNNSIIGCFLCALADTTEFIYWTPGAHDCVILGNSYVTNGGTFIPDVKHSIGGITHIQSGTGWSSGQKAEMWFGDEYQRIQAVHSSGLVFQAKNESGHAFRWKNHSGTELMALTGDSGVLYVNGNIKASGGVAAGEAHVTPSTSNSMKWETISTTIGDGTAIRSVNLDNVTSSNFLGMMVYLKSDTSDIWVLQGNESTDRHFDATFNGGGSVSIFNRQSDVDSANKDVKIVVWYSA